ncbi:MAG: hypothetical protein ACTSQX_10605 [Candidatus Heimdallarchaeota archaeon]
MTFAIIVLAILGMLSPIIYTVMWIIGGIIVPPNIVQCIKM